MNSNAFGWTVFEMIQRQQHSWEDLVKKFLPATNLKIPCWIMKSLLGDMTLVILSYLGEITYEISLTPHVTVLMLIKYIDSSKIQFQEVSKFW